jgi:hypothetical protein
MTCGGETVDEEIRLGWLAGCRTFSRTSLLNCQDIRRRSERRALQVCTYTYIHFLLLHNYPLRIDCYYLSVYLFIYHILLYSFGYIFYHFVCGCVFCVLLFNCVNCVFLSLCLCILVVMYVIFCVFCFIVLFCVLFVFRKPLFIN